MDKALGDLDKALEINKDYVKAMVKKGDILMGQEKYEEAMREYSSAKEVEPGNT